MASLCVGWNRQLIETVQFVGSIGAIVILVTNPFARYTRFGGVTSVMVEWEFIRVAVRNLKNVVRLAY